MAAILRTIESGRTTVVDIVDVVAAGTDGLLVEVSPGSLPILPNQYVFSIDAPDIVADGADSVLSAYIYILNHAGNRPDDMSGAGYCPIQISSSSFSTQAANATSPYEFYTSGSAGVKSVNWVTWGAINNQIGVQGFGAGICVRATDGGDSWTGGTITVAIAGSFQMAK